MVRSHRYSFTERIRDEATKCSRSIFFNIWLSENSAYFDKTYSAEEINEFNKITMYLLISCNNRENSTNDLHS